MKKIKNDIEMSIVIPAFNEANNIVKLVEEIFLALKKIRRFEVIIVDDGSTDKTLFISKKLMKKFSRLRLVKHRKNYGQSISIRSGILKSMYNYIVTIDGDGQNNPKDILKLLKSFQKNENFFLVIGNRANRNDNFSRKIASRFAFFIRKILLNDKVPDTGCALKIFKKSDFLMLPFFNHIHRFFPILFKAYGGKVISVKVSHRRRLNGNSKYSNLSRALAGIYDIFGVLWLRKRSIIARIDK